MKLTFNNAVDNTNYTTLKEYLLEQGYNFPCSGRGICGKCIVRIADVLPTDRDRRFLTAEQLQKGLRLACDKMLSDGMVIEAEIEKVPHFSDADACAILNKDRIEVYFVADQYIEHKVEGISQLNATTLKSATAHALLEMLEKHSVAKATTIYLLGEQSLVSELVGDSIDGAITLDGSMLMLPCDEVYVVPFGDYTHSLEYVLDKANADVTTSIKRLVNDFRFRMKL